MWRIFIIIHWWLCADVLSRECRLFIVYRDCGCINTTTKDSRDYTKYHKIRTQQILATFSLSSEYYKVNQRDPTLT